MPKSQQLTVGGKTFAVSNVEKVYFPGSGFKKGEALAFYSEIAGTVLPHLKNRPLTLKRYPDGVTGEPFYEKNAPAHTPAWVKTFAVPRSEGGTIRYILCNDLATLLWTTNLGDIEKHVLLARTPTLGCPTAMVFDLDPGDGVGILECGRVALRLKATLDALGLQSFVKVSGSKGLHLSVPLNGTATYEVTQPFAKAIAELVQRETPALVVSDMAKARRHGKVLIDWSQNSDFKTTVCVYAMRAKADGPFISMPLAWDELTKAVRAAADKRLSFTPAQAVERIGQVGDLFAPVLILKQKLPPAFTKALAAGPTPKLANWQRNRRSNDTSVERYAAKRDHTKTPEPAGTTGTKSKHRTGVHRYVIQKHDASHLHFDWRLEMEGVLRSWAVPKGPPTELHQARLAMHVEDHPMAYENFEGAIPKGNYGGGTVMVWDRGEYEDLTGDPAAAYHAGKMHLVMRGVKLKGEWILLKDKRDEGDRWLLIKAGEPMVPLSAKAEDQSVLSHRTMKAIAKAKDATWQDDVKKSARRPARNA